MKTKQKAQTTSRSSGKISQQSAPRSHASKDSLVDIDNLTVQFGGQNIVERASLCIHAGEFIGIIGPNGAGKTTLLRSLLQLQKPTKGSITVKPNIRIGYVPQRGVVQDPAVPMSVFEVVRLGVRGDADKAREALAEMGIEKIADRRITELSGGQQQKVLIAKELAVEPDIIFLDEPTTGIDEASQRDFYETIHRLHASGIAIVMVSHDIDVVLQRVERVIFINQTIRYDGVPDQFKIEAYLPSFYAGQHRLLHHHHKGAAHA